jgi:small subunit ribosomal protein S17
MRDQRKRLVGVVTSDKMDKTVIVETTTTKRHPVYGKVMRVRKKFKAHDENNDAKVGDRVEIIESKPISRHKRFMVTSIVERAK